VSKVVGVAAEATTYRDSSGRTLADYPRPSVAVDTALLTVTEDRLSVLLTLTEDAARGGKAEWRLPGTFIHEGETLAGAVLRSLRDKAGVEGLAPRQLHVFDDPSRDDRGWVLGVAHLDVVRADRLPESDRTRLIPISELPPLKYDHASIVEFAVAALRADYRRMPDAAGLLEPPFTLRALRHLHEAVLGERLLPDTFRRSMTPMLIPTGELSRDGRGRPAELYRPRAPGAV